MCYIGKVLQWSYMLLQLYSTVSCFLDATHTHAPKKVLLSEN